MAGQDRVTLRNVYLYLVCLITLVISIFAAVSLVRNIVELAYPGPGAYFEYATPAGAPGDPPKESAADRERQAKLQREAERRSAVLGLVGAGTTLLIVGPLYAYHWRQVQREARSHAALPAGGAPPVS